MTNPTDDVLTFALQAARSAAPNLAGDDLDAAVTAAVTALVSQQRSLQVAVQKASEAAVTEREVLTAAQLWVTQNNVAGLSPLAEILAGHRTYGFDPADADGLDAGTVAEAATEAHLRQFARAERLQRELDAATGV